MENLFYFSPSSWIGLDRYSFLTTMFRYVLISTIMIFKNVEFLLRNMPHQNNYEPFKENEKVGKKFNIVMAISFPLSAKYAP